MSLVLVWFESGLGLVWVWFKSDFRKKRSIGVRSVQLFLSCTRLIGVGLVSSLFAIVVVEN